MDYAVCNFLSGNHRKAVPLIIITSDAKKSKFQILFKLRRLNGKVIWFNGISTLNDYLMSNPIYTYDF